MVKGKPYNKNDYIITPVMWRNILGQVFLQIFVLSFLVFGFYSDTLLDMLQIWASPAQNNTLIFNTLVMMQLFNLINCRKIHENGKLLFVLIVNIDWNVFGGMLKNPYLIAVIIVIMLLQLILV